MLVQEISQQTNLSSSTKNRPATGRYSLSIPKIAWNLNKLAKPIMAILALYSLSRVEAGPLSYSACCLGCTASLPPAVPLCLSFCTPFLFFPSP